MNSKIEIENNAENKKPVNINHILQWCEKMQIKIPEQKKEQPASNFILPYHFVDETYTNISSLVTALATHWEEGKEQLFQGHLSAHFQSGNPNYFILCMNAEQGGKSKEKADLLYSKFLYQFNTEASDFYWKGNIFSSLAELGKDLLHNLWHDNFSKEAFFTEIIQETALSTYVKLVLPKEENLYYAVQHFEQLETDLNTSKRERTKFFYQLAYFLSENKSFYFNEQQFTSLEEFILYVKECMETSFEDLQKICHQLIDKKGKLDIQWESWLVALGKWTELKQWKKSLSASAKDTPNEVQDKTS